METKDGAFVAYGVVAGTVLFAFTGDAWWIAIGVAIGAGMAATRARQGE